MESGTPYNSIYEAVGSGKNSNRSSGEKEDLVCCSHGAKCPISHQETEVVVNMDDPDEDEQQYVNLLDEANKEREAQLKSMKKQLEELGTGKNPRQKKKEKKETTRLVKVEHLEETGTIPPYNSIYEAISCGNRKRSSREEDEVCCCAHGPKGCAVSKEEEQSEMNREELLNSMKKLLEDLELGKNPRQKKKEKKKIKSKQKSRLTKGDEIEDEVFPRKPIRVVKPQIGRKSKGNSFSSGKEESLNSGVFRTEKEPKGLKSDLLFDTYVGAMTFEEAEQLVKKNTDFRLYHRLERPLSVDDLDEHSSLHFVYRTIHGEFRHFPICKRMVCGEVFFFIDYGNPRAEGHPTLEELINFYKNNTRFHKRFVDIGHAQ